MKYVDKNSKIIINLENTVNNLKIKNNKYKEENLNVVNLFRMLQKQYKNMVFLNF